MSKRKLPNESLYKSTEFVEDSSDEETETSTRKSHLSPSKLTNGPSRGNSLQEESSRGTSGSDAESESDPAENDSPADVQSKDKASDSENESSSTEEEDDDEATDSDTSSTISQKNRNIRKPIASKPKKRGPAVTIAPKQFEPPEGYERYSLTASDYASEMSGLFDDLTTKQIWHISAPESLPLDLVQSLDIQAAIKGDPILTHNGISYNMNLALKGSEVLLLPSGSAAFYSQSAVAVSRSFQLTEMVKPSKRKADDAPLSNSFTTPVFSANSPGQKKSPRLQPGGLKMRYIPYGVSVNDTANGPDDVRIRDQFHVPEINGEIEDMDIAREKKKNKSKQHNLSDETEFDNVRNTKHSDKNKSIQTPTKTLSLAGRTDSMPNTEKRKKKKRVKLIDEEGL